MKRTKYICFEEIAGVMHVIVTFPSCVEHVVMARLIGAKPITAGFVQWTVDGPECVGKSVGLNLHSRASDTDLLRGWLSS